MKPLAILALQNIPRIGDKTLKSILSLSNNADPASPRDLYEIIKKAKFKFDKISLPDLSSVENGWTKAIEILDKSKDNGIEIIGKDSPYYPSLLLNIDNPPELLHIKGNINILNSNGIAIVGTRKPTEYGIFQAMRLSENFAERNYAIISGLAKGIDTAAHEGALNVNGQTIAVLAHGLDTVYPKENKELAERILDNNGVLVSEYFFGKKSTKGSFVARDRIQSGLSLSVLVVETKETGGTMHTVDYCQKQGRPLIVLEVPRDFKYVDYYAGNVNLINEKVADFILKCDNKKAKCFITSNQCDEIFSDKSMKTHAKNYEKLVKYTEPSINRSRIQGFVNYLLNFSFPYNSKYLEANDKKLNREDQILNNCKHCENLNICKLAEEGFTDLCSFKTKAKRLSVKENLHRLQ